MKVAYFDTIAGISGDMTLGAFVSAGFSVNELSSQLNKLNLSGFELEARHVERSGIVAVKIDVIISDQPKYHRHLKDIYELINTSALSSRVKEQAKKIFHEIGVAEAKVHDSTLEKVHFHEVGAVDSLVDIVGTAICLEHFGIESVFSSPVKLGSGGFVNTEHGKMPIPTPATLEILKAYPTILTEIASELTTPTGAAIIKSLSKGVLSAERIRVQSIVRPTIMRLLRTRTTSAPRRSRAVRVSAQPCLTSGSIRRAITSSRHSRCAGAPPTGK